MNSCVAKWWRSCPGGFEHDRVVMNTSFLLEYWARRTGEGRVLTGEVGLPAR